jgi:hypothetical protein
MIVIKAYDNFKIYKFDYDKVRPHLVFKVCNQHNHNTNKVSWIMISIFLTLQITINFLNIVS